MTGGCHSSDSPLLRFPSFFLFFFFYSDLPEFFDNYDFIDVLEFALCLFLFFLLSSYSESESEFLFFSLSLLFFPTCLTDSYSSEIDFLNFL